MTLKMPGYLPRVVDRKIEEDLLVFGAISVEGPKWCGKTWTALNHANSANYLLDPTGGYSNKQRALIDPSLALEGSKPHLIDEWQEVPGIWDAIRFDVDQTPGVGKYLLTGSVTPRRDTYQHSGTGRFSILRMRPMSLFESGDSTCSVSFDSILRGEPIDPFSADLSLERLVDITIRGGWPETLSLTAKQASRVSVEYINMILKKELFDDSTPKRNSAKFKTLLRAAARSNATIVNVSTLSSDINGQSRSTQNPTEIMASRTTTAEYLDDLKRLFVVEDILGWDPGIRSKTRIRMTPKLVFADPSLAIAALGLSRDRLLKDLNTFGFMFENLCLRDIAVYAENYGGSLYHYRDNSDLEVDAIVEMQDGSWGAFEIKLGEHQVEPAIRTLKRLRDKMVENGAEPPAFLCVITGGGFGRLREDGIYVIPINSFKC